MSEDIPVPRAPEIVDRKSEVARVISGVANADCCSIVGVSNVGKSTLLRALPALCRADSARPNGQSVLVYIDLNLVSQISEQGFYEVILRDLLRTVEEDSDSAHELALALREAYRTVVAQDNPFLVPLAFENSLDAYLSHCKGRLVLLFDEFDEALAELDARVLVRLRALKDRYWSRLCYVTATDRPLAELRDDRRVGEFCELFAPHTVFLLPLARGDACLLAQQRLAHSSAPATANDVEFVLDCAGGHPALLQATCRAVDKAKQVTGWRATEGNYERLREQLSGDPQIRLECAKLWTDLSAPEQEALLQLVAGQDTIANLNILVEKGLVFVSGATRRVFSDLFAGFVSRQNLVRHRAQSGVRVDVESGEAWVDGKLVPTLTESEYKLLLLLYGNLDKICDKYRIVESVWGEAYLDEVDDARIEKLVSRLRQKIEPSPDEPKYLLTVRGRGYKLAQP